MNAGEHGTVRCGDGGTVQLPSAGASRRWRWRIALPLAVAAIAILMLQPTPQRGRAIGAEQIDDPVWRIEEDWILVLNEPDSDTNSPEFYTVMSPVNYTGSSFAQVAWNFLEIPEYVPGGIQVQAWNGDLASSTESTDRPSLFRNADTLTWTQVLSREGGPVQFKITNGNSTSWGSFGGDSLSIYLPAASEAFSCYTSLLSQRYSCITYGSNRVNLLAINEVRRFTRDGTLLSVDTTQRVVYQSDE